MISSNSNNLGTCAAIGVTPMLISFFKLGPSWENGIAFLIGLGALQFVPVFFSLIDRLRGLKLPNVPDAKE